MIPDNTLSSQPVTAPFVERVNRRTIPLVDYERGGVALLDGSLGLNVQEWKVEVVGADVFLSAETVSPFVLFTHAGITEVSLAFDYSMNPAVAYVDGTGPFLRWFDTSVGGVVTTAFPGIENPRITMDEKRIEFAVGSDIILAYTRANALYYRQQRDRFLTERLLASDVNARLISVGMNRSNRLQFRMIPT